MPAFKIKSKLLLRIPNGDAIELVKGCTNSWTKSIEIMRQVSEGKLYTKYRNRKRRRRKGGLLKLKEMFRL